MKINYGLMVVAKEFDSKGDRQLYHFCGYVNPPTAHERATLEAELKSNKEFEIPEEYLIIDASSEILEYMNGFIIEHGPVGNSSSNNSKD
jgi:hypothetical protein